MTSITRRVFLQRSAVVATAAFGQSTGRGTARVTVPPALDLDALARFVDPLPKLVNAIPESSSADRSDAGTGAVTRYRVAMRAVERRIHRDLPPTRFWSFGDTFPGPTIDVRRDAPIAVTWVNDLPSRHFLPVDPAIHGAELDKPGGRAVVHVHGARVRPEFDGHPDRWIAPGASTTYDYPNGQPAATLWYHDHTMGLNRLNVYAGLMGLYLVRDAGEDALDLPRGDREIALLLCDRQLDRTGQLFYPISEDPTRIWVPEVFGGALLVNGALFPYLDVEPAAYRFRIVNGSNGRFLRLTLSGGPPFVHIGSDQGFLGAPVPSATVVLAPAERADVLVDFSAGPGRTMTLDNDGRPAMEIRVGRAAPARATARTVPLQPLARLSEASASRTRTHLLGEDDDLRARPMRMLLNGTPWDAPVTEIAEIDSTEIWRLVNVTDDAHPIHLHLVRFQILDRRPFDVFTYLHDGALRFVGPAEPPDPAEAGWKDTVRAYPGMVTRIVVRFEGFTGRYMWHCHVLEHGDNEMMRPMEIVPRGARA